jgi:type IV secretory pathway TrbL component
MKRRQVSPGVNIKKVKGWVIAVRIVLGLMCPFSLGILLGLVLIPFVLSQYFNLVFAFKHLN